VDKHVNKRGEIVGEVRLVVDNLEFCCLRSETILHQGDLQHPNDVDDYIHKAILIKLEGILMGILHDDDGIFTFIFLLQ